MVGCLDPVLCNLLSSYLDNMSPLVSQGSCSENTPLSSIVLGWLA